MSTMYSVVLVMEMTKHAVPCTEKIIYILVINLVNVAFISENIVNELLQLLNSE